MLRFIAVLLLGILATLIVVRALRHGVVQASFVRGNVQRRKDDPVAFWFITALWFFLAIGGVVGSSILLYHGINSSGPFSAVAFFALRREEWPLGVLTVACLYLLTENFHTRKSGRSRDGG